MRDICKSQIILHSTVEKGMGGRGRQQFVFDLDLAEWSERRIRFEPCSSSSVGGRHV
jgi:hypothetical protein